MTTDYNELVGVSFNDYVTYSCKFGFYFEHDREQESFKVKCVKKDQYIGFIYPAEWPKCVTGMNFLSPNLKKHLITILLIYRHYVWFSSG